MNTTISSIEKLFSNTNLSQLQCKKQRQEQSEQQKRQQQINFRCNNNIQIKPINWLPEVGIFRVHASLALFSSVIFSFGEVAFCILFMCATHSRRNFQFWFMIADWFQFESSAQLFACCIVRIKIVWLIYTGIIGAIWFAVNRWWVTVDCRESSSCYLAYLVFV